MVAFRNQRSKTEEDLRPGDIVVSNKKYPGLDEFIDRPMVVRKVVGTSVLLDGIRGKYYAMDGFKRASNARQKPQEIPATSMPKTNVIYILPKNWKSYGYAYIRKSNTKEGGEFLYNLFGTTESGNGKNGMGNLIYRGKKDAVSHFLKEMANPAQKEKQA